MTHPEIEVALAKRIENPAWDYIERVPEDPHGFRPWPQKSSFSLHNHDFVGYRDRVTSSWTWAIPAPESVAWIVTILDGRPVVEIGAGCGYWAWLLAQSGVDVNAYDLYPVGHEQSWYSPEFMLRKGRSGKPVDVQEFYPIKQAGVEALTLPENQDRVLFTCWPMMEKWAGDMLLTYQGPGVIYIGEGPGGCTGDPVFHKLLNGDCCCWGTDEEPDPHDSIEQQWGHVSEGPLIQWSGLNDYLSYHERKS